MSGIGPKYDAQRINTYSQLNKNVIVSFFADNWQNVEYDTQKLSKLINITDEQVLDDLQQVLISSLIVNFNGGYTQNGYTRRIIQIDYEVETTNLKQILYNQLQTLLFKRIVDTSTPYGFI